MYARKPPKRDAWLRAALKEGVRVRIEIAPDDGRISIIPMIETLADVAKGPTGPNEWDGM